MYGSKRETSGKLPSGRIEAFKDLIDEGHVAIYMDDILIYTWTIEHHRAVVTQVLDVL